MEKDKWMEEHISKYSSTAVNIKKTRYKKKKLVIVFSVIIILGIVFAIYKYHRHQKWLAYMDRYYYPFIEKNNIEDYEQGDVGVEAHLKYEYKGDSIDFLVYKPTKDKFNFQICLMSNCVVNKNACWTVSSNDYIYAFDFYVKVDEDGNWGYHVTSNYSRKSDGYTIDALFFDIDENGHYIQDDDFPLTAKDREILDELQPDIKELYDEMRYVILDGIV
ncbi:hypothetical protein [Ruminococcus albus]|nr:hypothetical protein [Ruminococcus albus]